MQMRSVGLGEEGEYFRVTPPVERSRPAALASILLHVSLAQAVAPVHRDPDTRCRQPGDLPALRQRILAKQQCASVRALERPVIHDLVYFRGREHRAMRIFVTLMPAALALLRSASLARLIPRRGAGGWRRRMNTRTEVEDERGQRGVVFLSRR